MNEAMEGEKSTAADALDYSNWMGNLPDSVTRLPLHQIAIPGSHDSFSYSISKDTDITPDDPSITFLNKIPCVGHCAKTIVYRWSVTQAGTCTEQLNSGIRYFDLRLAPNPSDGQICLIHGLYGIGVKTAMTDVQAFLRAHPREVVILDFQHFYEFTPELHSSMISGVLGTFGNMVCPFISDPKDVSLSWLWRSGYQVLIFYRNPSCYQFPMLWASDYMPNPWANTASVERFLDFLNNNYKHGRPLNKFYVTQGVLTPDTNYVVLRLLSSLKDTLTSVANSALNTWLEGKVIGQNGINIVMFDFTVLYPRIIKQVIDLNYVSPSRYTKGDSL